MQSLDNILVLVTSGTGIEFGLSRNAIMDMGTWPGKETREFTVFQLLLVVNGQK
jgi:hypothetical protein